ncbi:hypothetical protein [Acinetobacter sp. YH12145]|uniref:hypothetical protein n=1 Tax=Acinetobacter sp. YH12145 TaxID=2601129 RepID=UPI0015D28D08|nr:hypothetical protein [Acinetobacter sp. YH12145]
MENKGLENQTVEVTLKVNNALMGTGYSLTSQPDFHLTVMDFYNLKSPARKFDLFSSSVFFIGIGLLFTSVGRYIAQQMGYATKIEPYEVIAGFGAIGIAIICYAIGSILPNPKKELFKKIEEHFASNPPSRSIVRAKDN